MVAFDDHVIIPPGAEHVLNVKIKPGRPGQHRQDFVIYASDKWLRTFELAIEGTVVGAPVAKTPSR